MTNSTRERTDLPTIAEIKASTDILSVRTNAIKVVRVRERFAVKVGLAIPPLEAENMKFVAANSKAPVPKVHDHFLDPDTQRRYIIMDYIPGSDLQKLLPSLKAIEKKTVSQRVKEAIDELRSIPAQRYFGNLSHGPYTDGVLSTSDNNPSISGPFEYEEQLNNGLLKRLSQKESPHYIYLLQEMVNRTLKDHKIGFTHGDLQPKNIMVERHGVLEDGSTDFKITMLDWNLSGWYPEYWEFCNSTLYCQYKSDWLELVPKLLESYPLEYLMMQVIYSSVFY
ncbi:kinase-like protein [Aspergillus ellipticus CBS 707.79]|uniref:Kinase-like protein n=1 Tax=Aspergillus ellipticus CBS 707.79 TaxID=1448320 RepID=A0A319DNJ2_9EURO|nr:kinase-like protein [Aspergillus ellipticus CBS 707.79]